MTQKINLSDYDFSAPQGKSRTGGTDVCACVRIKGKGRKCTAHDFILNGFFSKNPDLKYGYLGIGVSKVSKTKNQAIMVFDKPALVGSHTISHSSTTKICSSRGLVRKVYDAFGITVPEIAGTSSRLYLNLERIEGTPDVYLIIPVSLERVDSVGSVSKVNFTEDGTATMATIKKVV